MSSKNYSGSEMQDIEVCLFLGFLDSGKTKFIQETFEDARMDNGQRTLLLVCEEGDEEYRPDRFNVKNVVKVTIEDEKELTRQTLCALTVKHKPERVIIEYNGMWLLDALFEAMPEEWVIVQMMTFFDARGFSSYNKNMRQLVFDKIRMTQLVVFNRFESGLDKTEFHKAVRAISRRPDIVYESCDGKAEYDDIEDEMPFDKNAPVIEVEDRDFAWFFRDVSEKTDDYVGKTVRFKGMAAVPKGSGKGGFVLGRHIMTCCEADTSYEGLVVVNDTIAVGVKTRDWFVVTGKIAVEKHPIYRAKGPVIYAESIARADAPEELVATFY